MSATTDAKIPLHHFTGWLAMGERGLSSEAIVQHLTGTPISGYHWGAGRHPRDPADFRRCQLLLDAVPLAKLAFPAMRSASPEWARLVDQWDEIHEAIAAEVPDYLGRWTTGRATRGYYLMKRVIAGGDPCEACDSTGRGAPCDKCKGTGRRSGGRCRAPRCYRGHDFCRTCRGEGYVGGAA